MWFNPKSNFIKAKKFFEKNEAKLSIAFFLVGFIIDNLTLTRIDSLIDNLVLLSWLLVAFLFIFLNAWGDYRGVKSKFLYKIYTFSPLVIQLAFGALFSGYVIFYSRSSSFFDSWPFLIILYFLFIANEKFRKYYEKFHIQITIFYFAIFSFLIFYIPILFKKMNDFIFIYTGIISLILIYFILKFFLKIIPNFKKFKFKIIRNILFIFIIVNLFYFNGLLPPVPLSIKNIEVLHYADRNENGNYVLAREKRHWYNLHDWFYNVIHWKKGNKIFIYAAVFAPTNFKTSITYMWYWYNPKLEKWVYIQKYKQSIIGGRNNGFRSGAYMQKAVRPGDWMVRLVSNEGSVLGRLKFRVEEVEYDIAYEKDILKK